MLTPPLSEARAGSCLGAGSLPGEPGLDPAEIGAAEIAERRQGLARPEPELAGAAAVPVPIPQGARQREASPRQIARVSEALA